MVEASIASYKIVTEAGEGEEIDPDRVQLDLLQGGRDEGDRNIGIQGVDACVVTVRTADGTGGWGGRIIGPTSEKGIESALVRDKCTEYIILNKMEEVIG